MEKEGWKKLAIVFIALFVIETLCFIGLTMYGLDEIDKESQCSISCDNNHECISFGYDSWDSTCTLYGSECNSFFILETTKIN